MVHKTLLVAALLLAVGCAQNGTSPSSAVEFIQIETQPPSMVQVDGQPVQAPATVPLDTHNVHTVVWPDGTQSQIHPTDNGFWDWIMPGMFPALEPGHLMWVEGQGVVAGG